MTYGFVYKGCLLGAAAGKWTEIYAVRRWRLRLQRPPGGNGGGAFCLPGFFVVWK